MAGTRAAIRYAKAVLDLALSLKKADTVNIDMVHIANTIANSKELANMIENSVIKAESKKTALLAIFPKLDTISIELLNILITNKRVDILNDVAIKYTELLAKYNGKETATVTTAVPLTKELEEKVLAKIKALTSKTVELKSVVDETIIGGFILRIGDKQFDASISNKLNKLKREFTLN